MGFTVAKQPILGGKRGGGFPVNSPVVKTMA